MMYSHEWIIEWRKCSSLAQICVLYASCPFFHLDIRPVYIDKGSDSQSSVYCMSQIGLAVIKHTDAQNLSLRTSSISFQEFGRNDILIFTAFLPYENFCTLWTHSKLPIEYYFLRHWTINIEMTAISICEADACLAQTVISRVAHLDNEREI